MEVGVEAEAPSTNTNSGCRRDPEGKRESAGSPCKGAQGSLVVLQASILLYWEREI